jgi:enoyl-[acyl-carrier protein] reductase I
MATGLMSGKRGLVMGVANNHSIAWGIAKRLSEHGAELAFTYQTPALGKRVLPLAKSAGSDFVLPCDVGLPPDAKEATSLDSTFAALAERWPTIDFIVHAIAFSDKQELRGRYADTSRSNFVNTMLVSCFSFTEVAKRAAAMMNKGGAMVTLTFNGSSRVMPNYNVMGVAKAALEASVRYLAADFGPSDIRVNAISAGPVRTLAGAGITDARIMFNHQKANAPLRRNVAIEEIGNTAVYLLSDLASAVTGEIHFVDSGYSIMAMPRLDALKEADTGENGDNGDDATTQAAE